MSEKKQLSKSYVDQTGQTAEKLADYEHNINEIFQNSINVTRDMISYIVNLLKEDMQDHEVGAVLIRIMQKKKYSRKKMIKMLVKLLFIIHQIDSMKYRDFNKLKKYIDNNLDNEYVKKNYNILLKKLSSQQIKKDVDQYYQNADDTAEEYLRQNISFI